MSTASGNGGSSSSMLYDLYGPNVRVLFLLRLSLPLSEYYGFGVT
jgi:hypothetical protein